MSPYGKEKVQVLHVDNDPNFLDLTKAVLERNNRIEVRTTTSPGDGLEIVAKDGIDCIISGYDIPGQNGVAFLKTVREKYPDLPFILLTGKGSEAVASEAISAGATDYIEKESGTEQYDLLANRIRNAVTKFHAKQRATRAERRLAQLTEATDDILWMVSDDWSEFLFVNSAYEDIWGESREELIEYSMSFIKGIHPEDRERATNMMECAADGESVDFELRVNADEDFQRWVWVQAKPIQEEDTNRGLIAGFVRDITERKTSKQKLEQQNKRLDEFVSIVSHDLRNPLTVADGYLELAQEECDTSHLASVANAIDRSQALVNDLLALARGGEGVTEIEPVELVEVAESSWQNVDTGAATLEADTKQVVKADQSQLKQLFENLYRNAIEHGGRGVTVSVGEIDGGFYVADTGPGIPKADYEEIFDVGYSTATGGSGFGLRIVEQTVNNHGWEIAVTESEQGGARFEISSVETTE